MTPEPQTPQGSAVINNDSAPVNERLRETVSVPGVVSSDSETDVLQTALESDGESDSEPVFKRARQSSSLLH